MNVKKDREVIKALRAIIGNNKTSIYETKSYNKAIEEITSKYGGFGNFLRAKRESEFDNIYWS